MASLIPRDVSGAAVAEITLTVCSYAYSGIAVKLSSHLLVLIEVGSL
jgi:hypothetical protein